MEVVGHLALEVHSEAEDPSAPGPAMEEAWEALMEEALEAPTEEAAPTVEAPMEEDAPLAREAVRVSAAPLVTGGLPEEAVALVTSEEATSPTLAALFCADLTRETAAR